MSVTKIKKICFLFIFCSSCFSQGYMNAIGLGKFYSNHGVKNAVDGICSLSPSVSKNVNFSNPSTWHNLKFTYLSLSYSADHTSIESKISTNAYSGLSNALWIIPIKSKYSVGFSISPYTNQKVNVVGSDTLTYVAFNDTFNISQSIKRSGGLLSFNIGSSYQYTQKASIGIITKLIFGSSRQNTSVEFEGSNILQTSRSRYTGLIGEVYFSFKLSDYSSLHSSFIKTLKPVEAAQLDKHLFDDANSNGFHDWIAPYYDFPFPDSVNSYPEYRISNIHNPNGAQFGINKIINENSSLAVEWSSNNDGAKGLNRIYLPIDKWISGTNSFALSITRFASSSSINLIDKISIRSGLKYSKYLISNDENSIQEYGYSAGVGFKFKNVGNQIDFNYYIGSREYPFELGKELIQQLQVSFSLADIWFIKRRQK